MAKSKTIEERNKELALVGKKLKFYGLKLRLKPNQDQFKLFNKTFGCARFVFNYFLNEKQEIYRDVSKNLSYGDFKKSFQTLKTHPLFNFLQEVDKFSLENSLMNVEIAFKNFFEGNAKYPKFKKKHDSKQSYTTNFTNHNIRIHSDKKTIQLPKVGEVSFVTGKKQLDRLKNGLVGDIKSATITKHASGQLFVAIKYEEIIDIKEKKSLKDIQNHEITGVDLGLTHFVFSPL